MGKLLNGKYCLKLIYKTFYSKIKVKTFGNDNKIVANCRDFIRLVSEENLNLKCRYSKEQGH